MPLPSVKVFISHVNGFRIVRGSDFGKNGVFYYYYFFYCLFVLGLKRKHGVKIVEHRGGQPIENLSGSK